MMLGELYKPKGLALETAQAVLQIKEPLACNVALGCSNRCSYCYIPKFMRKSDLNYHLRLPKKPPAELVRKQLDKMNHLPEGVFIPFMTDPFLPELRNATEDLIGLLLDNDIDVATLSKLGVPNFASDEYLRLYPGMTIVSLDEEFWRKFEPRTLRPDIRLALIDAYEESGWISMEPYPPSTIYKQNLGELLERFTDCYIDLIVFGMWNYDPRAKTEEARKEYAEDIEILTDFCKSNDIRLHVKSDTMRFIEGLKEPPIPHPPAKVSERQEAP